MPGFLGSLANVAAKGAVAYGDQQQENTRQIILEKARQAALARQEKLDAQRDEDRLYKRKRDEINDQLRGWVPDDESVTTVEANPVERPPRPDIGVAAPSPQRVIPDGPMPLTPVAPQPRVVQGMDGPITLTPPRVVNRGGGHYDPTRDPAQVRAAAVRAAALQAQKDRDAVNNDRADARTRTQHTNRMTEIGAREDRISGRAGKAEKLTQFDAPLQRAVHGAIAKMKAAGIDKPDEQQIYSEAMNILGTDPVLRPHMTAGRITRDMVWGAVGARGDRMKEKPETEEEKWTRENATPGSVAPAGGRPATTGRATPPAASITDPTDEEIDAAFDAGITDPAAVHAFVVKQRAKKP